MQSIVEKLIQSGLRPPTEAFENFIGPQWFFAPITFPNAATTAIDLTAASVVTGDQSVLARYNALAAKPDLTVHMEQVQLIAYDGATTALALSEKDKLIQGAYLYTKVQGRETAYNLGPHITELHQALNSTVDSDDATAMVLRGHLNGPPLILPQPLTVDLAADPLEIRFSTATPASPGVGFFAWYGAVWQGKLGDAVLQTKDGHIKCAGGRIKDPQLMGDFDRITGYGAARALGVARGFRK